MFIVSNFNRKSNRPINVDDVFTFYITNSKIYEEEKDNNISITFILNKKIDGSDCHYWKYNDIDEAEIDIKHIYEKLSLGEYGIEEKVYFDKNGQLIIENEYIYLKGEDFSFKVRKDIKNNELYIEERNFNTKIYIKDLDRNEIVNGNKGRNVFND